MTLLFYAVSTARNGKGFGNLGQEAGMLSPESGVWSQTLLENIFDLGLKLTRRNFLTPDSRLATNVQTLLENTLILASN